jgi:hypothetical protein
MLQNLRASVLSFLVRLFAKPVVVRLGKSTIRTGEAPTSVSISVHGGFGPTLWIHYPGSGHGSVDGFHFSKDEEDAAIGEMLFIRKLMKKAA